ncbi:hypothetical protein GCM10007190_06680 [Macrococcus hajekii]|uniref:hypothetical protein n=1 Tax=Macrococcus hajekii TaxID=198482 RepID=UPI0019A39EE1|nr:hypothetical protein [Macrococcus hajekii]GGB01269.1 hypothetical protein GCM10007190_06680 [Macrococcus hajekii]
MYFIQEMTQADQQEILKWRYTAPYERYNLTADTFEQEEHFYSVFSKPELIGMLKLHYNEVTCFFRNRYEP